MIKKITDLFQVWAVLFLFLGVFNSQGWGDPMDPKLKKATFGAGCFWGVEKIYAKIPGVVSTDVGYMGGSTQNPTYQEVCMNGTGHAEVVQVTYDPAKIYARPIVTQIVPPAIFYRAEEYHQQYLQKNPGGYCSHHLQSPKIRQVLKGKS